MADGGIVVMPICTRGHFIFLVVSHSSMLLVDSLGKGRYPELVKRLRKLSRRQVLELNEVVQIDGKHCGAWVALGIQHVLTHISHGNALNTFSWRASGLLCNNQQEEEGNTETIMLYRSKMIARIHRLSVERPTTLVAQPKIRPGPYAVTAWKRYGSTRGRLMGQLPSSPPRIASSVCCEATAPKCSWICGPKG